MITLRADTSAIDALADRFRAMGNQVPHGIRRGVNRAGAKALTQMRRALVGQTGLKYGVFVRALRPTRANFGSMSYAIKSRGGNVSLKFFKPREIRGGVVARPWNAATTYPGGFTRGGRPGRRVALRLGGHVFRRRGAARLPITKVKSGLFIPDEMISGASLGAFNAAVDQNLADDVLRELLAILSGFAPRG